MAYANYGNSKFDRASSGVAQRASALMKRAVSGGDFARIRRAAMNMQAGLMEKGLANSGG